MASCLSGVPAGGELFLAEQFTQVVGDLTHIAFTGAVGT
jgi:hypothetical protein